MSAQLLKILHGGKFVIPAHFRRELGIAAGDSVIVEMVEGELRVRPLSSTIKKARAIVREFIPASAGLVDELIAERRAEAEGE
jgi:AbrB family looped-hinge helix DNA binding protein